MKAKLVVEVWIAVIELCNTFIQFMENVMIFCQEVIKFGYPPFIMKDLPKVALNSYLIFYNRSPNILSLF